ncbi:hypothetical protein LguiB_000167 [Lonicera macranthoides]
MANLVSGICSTGRCVISYKDSIFLEELDLKDSLKREDSVGVRVFEEEDDADMDLDLENIFETNGKLISPRYFRDKSCFNNILKKDYSIHRKFGFFNRPKDPRLPFITTTSIISYLTTIRSIYQAYTRLSIALKA